MKKNIENMKINDFQFETVLNQIINSVDFEKQKKSQTLNLKSSNSENMFNTEIYSHMWNGKLFTIVISFEKGRQIFSH